MEFSLNNIFHVLLQQAHITEVMFNTHNDLNFVHYPNFLYKQHNILEIVVYFSFQVAKIRRDSYCVLRAPTESHSYILQHVYLTAEKNMTLHIISTRR